jgi:hypothetical protein
LKASAALVSFSTAHLLLVRPDFSKPNESPPQPEYKSRVCSLSAVGYRPLFLGLVLCNNVPVSFMTLKEAHSADEIVIMRML